MSTPNIHDIRPRVVFERLEAAFPNQDMKFSVHIPTSQIGGMTLLESAVLVSLARLSEAKEIFEFGTYMGATSVLLAANSRDDAHVTTLDIDASGFEAEEKRDENLRDATDNDNFLRRQHKAVGAVYVDRAEPDVRRKISRIFHDSRRLDVTQFMGRFDQIFIDGGHDWDTIKSDTEKALLMAKKDAIIVWHDYRSKIHLDVTRYVDFFSANRRIVHVQDTMLAILPTGRFEGLLG